MSAAGICVVAAGKTIALAAMTFTLSWTHSVEKTKWTEHWKATQEGFLATRASVEGSGAGMDPPPGSQFVDDRWVYVPALPPQERLVLAASGATGDGWHLCSGGTCRTVGAKTQTPIVIRRCDRPPDDPSRP